MQREILTGRSVIANVLVVERAALLGHFCHPRPSLVSFDFKAAFPSVSQVFLIESLEYLGVPREVMTAFRRLYVRNAQRVVLRGGRRAPPFLATVGIRQGCPLSPLLFAVVVDVCFSAPG